MMRTMIGARAQRGFSLVEMMVALVLGLLLLAGVLQFYLGNKATFITQEQNGYLQESGRYALGQIARDARMAGLAGCSSRPTGKPFPVLNHLNGTDPTYALLSGVRGYEANGTGPGTTLALASANPANSTDATAWTPALPTGSNALAGLVVPGSDVLLVTMTGPAVPLVDPFTDATSFKAAAPNDLQRYEVAVVTNCQQAEIFQITNLASGGSGKTNVVGSAASVVPGNSGPISNSGTTKDFRAGSEIAALRTYVYFVGRTLEGPPALFRSRLAVDASNNYVLAPEELISGVDSMQVTYGVDSDDDYVVNSYVAASASVDWTRVRSVRVALLVRSPEEFLPGADTATYRLAGTSVDPFNDRRQRRVFQSTIALRNRLL